MNLSLPRLPISGASRRARIAASLFFLATLSFAPRVASAAPNESNTPNPPPDPAPASATLLVAGAVSSPLTLQRADLAAMPRTHLSAKDKSGADVAYEGVDLAEILKSAGAPHGEELRGPALLLVALITASDGYHVVFSLAELDPAMTGRKVLLADTADGKMLPPETGPFRLVVPDDKRHARWVRQVTRIDVIRVDPPAP